MSNIKLLEGYGLMKIGLVQMPSETQFQITLVDDAAAQWEKAIYAMVVGDEIRRIGSSKGRLISRMKQWNRDVTAALEGNPKATRLDEAEAWATCLRQHNGGYVYARLATMVTTPIGSFRAYMDEESVLINKFKPPLNNHTNR